MFLKSPICANYTHTIKSCFHCLNEQIKTFNSNSLSYQNNYDNTLFLFKLYSIYIVLLLSLRIQWTINRTLSKNTDIDRLPLFLFFYTKEYFVSTQGFERSWSRKMEMWTSISKQTSAINNTPSQRWACFFLRPRLV